MIFQISIFGVARITGVSYWVRPYFLYGSCSACVVKYEALLGCKGQRPAHVFHWQGWGCFQAPRSGEEARHLGDWHIVPDTGSSGTPQSNGMNKSPLKGSGGSLALGATSPSVCGSHLPLSCDSQSRYPLSPLYVLFHQDLCVLSSFSGPCSFRSCLKHVTPFAGGLALSPSSFKMI